MKIYQSLWLEAEVRNAGRGTR